MKDYKDLASQPRRVALYAWTEMEGVFVSDVSYVDYDEHYNRLPEGEERELTHASRIRLTDPIEVTFKPISNDEVVAKAVAMLDQQERIARGELEKKLSDIREKRSQLLALTLQKDSV